MIGFLGKTILVIGNSKTNFSVEDTCNMNSMSDDDFNKIYNQYFRQLYIYALEILRNPSLAEEIVQETYLIAWIKYDKLKCSPNPGGWLMNTLKYTIRNMLRQTKEFAVPHLPLDEAIFIADEHDIISDKLFEIELDKACAKILSKTDYLILHKVALEGYTCVEVATMMGKKVSTCQKRYQRILKRLEKSEKMKQFWEK